MNGWTSPIATHKYKELRKKEAGFSLPLQFYVEKPATTLEQLCFKLKHLVSPQGWIQDFPKGGLKPAIRKAEGGGGVLCCPVQARHEKWGGSCLAEEGRGILYERGICNPQPPVSAPVPLPQGIRNYDSSSYIGIDPGREIIKKNATRV